MTTLRLINDLRKQVTSVKDFLPPEHDAIIAEIMSSDSSKTVMRKTTELVNIMIDMGDDFPEQEISGFAEPLLVNTLVHSGVNWVRKTSVVAEKDSQDSIKYCSIIGDLLLSVLSLHSKLDYASTMWYEHFPYFVVLMLENVDIMWSNNKVHVKEKLKLIKDDEEFLARVCDDRRYGTSADTDHHRKCVNLFLSRIEM